MSTHPIPHPRWLLFALAVGGFAIGTTEFATMSVLPYMAAGLGINEPTAGHLISAYALGVVIGAPLIAVLGARFSRRTLLLGLMLFFALAHLGTAMAASYHTMLLFRLLSGLPHGAYFGVGALVAAAMVPMAQRAQAVGLMMLGLTVATTIGVPFTGWLALALGWRVVFVVVSILALLTFVLVASFLPRQAMRGGGGSPLKELAALANPQIWLMLSIGAIGFGGMFAVYTYMASTLMEVTGVSAAMVPLVLSLFGVGMTLGNLIVPRLAGRHPMRGVCALLVWSSVMLAFYPWAIHHRYLLYVLVVLIGMGGAIGTLLQIALMDIACEAQTLAAALNHSAFNAANALGPFLGGLAISAGFGWGAVGWVGCLLALGGLLMWWLSMRYAHSTHQHKMV